MPGKVGRGLGWSTASNLVLRIANLLVSIILARIIAPEQFGVFAVAMTVWTVLSSLAEFGLGADLVRANDLERRIPTVATMGLLIGAGLAFASVFVCCTTGRSIQTARVRRRHQADVTQFDNRRTIDRASSDTAEKNRQAALFGINGSAMIVSASTMTIMALMGFGPVALARDNLLASR